MTRTFVTAVPSVTLIIFFINHPCQEVQKSLSLSVSSNSKFIQNISHKKCYFWTFMLLLSFLYEWTNKSFKFIVISHGIYEYVLKKRNKTHCIHISVNQHNQTVYYGCGANLVWADTGGPRSVQATRRTVSIKIKRI